MFLRRAVLLAALTFACAPADAAGGSAVTVRNRSEPVLCAEKDNVTVEFAAAAAKGFRVEAAHPAYIGTLRQDRWEPDWTGCTDISAETSAGPAPEQVALFESRDMRLVGHVFPSFWRPNPVTVRVGERAFRNLALVQLFVRHEGRMEEVVAFYPADGYWRLRPLPAPHLTAAVYGSSVLIGPVDLDGRPVVNLTEIAFEPASRTARLAYADGNRAAVRLDALDQERIALDVAFDRPVGPQPFAALRSMYVTEFNADVARIALREEGANGWREEPVMRFGEAKASDVWLGRLVPSRHNTSAPDTVFSRFRAE
ncbi:MAG TPA: hypothetical protein VIL65_01205 [Beijerinckiaceae bacterium]|jgi:hypothetical protein